MASAKLVTGFGFSPNNGKLQENLIFLALRRQTREIYYYTTPSGYAVDYDLPEKRQLIQVAQHLENPSTREREVRALEDAINRGLRNRSTKTTEICRDQSNQIRKTAQGVLKSVFTADRRNCLRFVFLTWEVGKDGNCCFAHE